MNLLKINIKGKRIESFIKRLIDANIDLINIEYISYNEINVLIYRKDYNKLKKIKTIYKIKIVKKYGFIHIKEIINKNIILIISGIIGCFFLFILSNIIFNVKVIHNNEELRNTLYSELENHGIKKHKLKKNKKEIERIKEKILEEYKDKIEWLEIENIGTTYIIRVEERIIPNIINDNTPRHLVAKKNTIIRHIEAKNGSVERLRGEYVKKGDIIISGEIKLNENIKSYVHADGKVYGEVWYNLKIDYPYVYQEEKKTNKNSTSLDFTFLNKLNNLIGTKYRYQKTKEIFRITSNLLPIYLSINENEEIDKIDYILTCDQASDKAVKKGQNQISKRLKENEYIFLTKILSSKCEINKASLEIFYAVVEDVTDYQIVKQNS